MLKFQQFLGIERRLLTMQQSMNKGNEGKNMKRERDKAFYTAHIKQDHEFCRMFWTECYHTVVKVQWQM